MASQPTIRKIFCEKRNFILRSEGSDQRRELRISVERETKCLPVAQKVLNIHISDDEDPYFICGAHITEEDYKVMRDSQNLLVDFEYFHQHVVRLFSQCTGTSDCRFMLVLTRGVEKTGSPDQLQVVEATNFKNLCHISLPVLRGSDDDIKKNMTITIRQLQDENKALAINLVATKSKFLQLSRKLQHQDLSHKEFQEKYLEEKAVLRSEFDQKLLEIVNTHNKELVNARNDFQLEKQCLEDKYEDAIRNIESQTTSLKAQVKTAMEKNSQAENDKRELEMELSNSKVSLSALHQELSTLKQQNFELDREYHHRGSMLQSLNARIAELDKELSNKYQILKTQQEANSCLLEHQKKLEESLKEKESCCDRLKSSLRTVSDDFLKANELLILHQKELMKIKNKVKASAAVLFEHERIIASKNNFISKVNEFAEECTRSNRELQATLNDLRETLKKSEEMVMQKEKRIKINESVIKRLNESLAELQTGQVPPKPWMPLIFRRLVTRCTNMPRFGTGGFAVTPPFTSGNNSEDHGGTK